MQSTGQESTQAVSCVSMQGSPITYAIESHAPRREGEPTANFSKNAAIGTGGPTQQRLSKVEKRLSDFQLTERQMPARSVHPSAPCAIGSPASVCGTRLAGIRAGAPRHAPTFTPPPPGFKM